jgi:drug/metabolite transporter (DMT)-like permease
MKQKSDTRSIIILLVAIIFLSTTGVFVRLVDVPPINSAFYRMLFSIPFLIPFAIKQRSDLKTLDKKYIYLIVLSGVFYALNLAVWNISFLHTTLANANLFGSLTPLFIVPFSYLVFKEKVSGKFIIGAVITAGGVVVLLLGRGSTGHSSIEGDMLALLASLLYAGYILTIYKVRNYVRASLLILLCVVPTLLVTAIIIVFTEGFHLPTTTQSLLSLIGLGAISQALGQGLFSYSLGKITASTTSVISLCQPVIAAAFALVIFKEFLSVIEILGILIALVGVYLAKKWSSPADKVGNVKIKNVKTNTLSK